MATVIVIAAMLTLVALVSLSHEPVCILCGGRGAHKKGCPEE